MAVVPDQQTPILLRAARTVLRADGGHRDRLLLSYRGRPPGDGSRGCGRRGSFEGIHSSSVRFGFEPDASEGRPRRNLSPRHRMFKPLRRDCVRVSPVVARERAHPTRCVPARRACPRRTPRRSWRRRPAGRPGCASSSGRRRRGPPRRPRSRPRCSMSVFRDGQEVIVRPLSTSASTSVHGPWQMTPTGFSCSKNARTKPTASSSVRRKSGLATPPGSTSPS